MGDVIAPLYAQLLVKACIHLQALSETENDSGASDAMVQTVRVCCTVL
jgi:hypothetical protein